MCKFHYFPFTGRNMPGKPAVLDIAFQVNKCAAVNFSIRIQLACQGSYILLTAVTISFEQTITFGIGTICRKTLCRVFRWDVATDALTWPPLFVEDPHLEVVFLCCLEAYGEIPIPSFAEPVIVRT